MHCTASRNDFSGKFHCLSALEAAIFRFMIVGFWARDLALSSTGFGVMPGPSIFTILVVKLWVMMMLMSTSWSSRFLITL